MEHLPLYVMFEIGTKLLVFSSEAMLFHSSLPVIHIGLYKAVPKLCVKIIIWNINLLIDIRVL